MEEKHERGGAVRVGLVWGGIGGVVGLLVSLPGSLVGIVVAPFFGISCGRRAAAAGGRGGGGSPGRGGGGAGAGGPGAIPGLGGGAVAAPVYAIGSTLGALLTGREIGASMMATSLSDMLGTQI